MDEDCSDSESSVERFFNEITANVMRCALDQVAASWIEDVHVMEDKGALLEQVNRNVDKDSLLSSVSHVNVAEMGCDFEEIHSDAIYARCREMTEDILSEIYTEMNRILESGEQRMASNIETTRKKVQLIHCIRNSDHIQNFFQDISANIIQSVLKEIRIDDGNNVPKNETSKSSIMKSDIGHDNSNMKAGNSTTVIFKNSHPNMATTCQDSDAQFNISVTQDNSWSKDKFDEQDSTLDLSFYSIQNENSLSKTESTNLYATGLTTTADSVMFTTADDNATQQSYDDESGAQEQFVSFNNERLAGFESEPHDTTESKPIRMQNEESILEKTVTGTIAGPRQSTPLAQDKNEDLLGDLCNMPAIDNSNIQFSDGSQVISVSSENDILNKSEHELQMLTDDESSIGDPCSPRTLSRQSSSFGNVTLEFDTEWEPGMQGFQQENQNQGKEEKHKVILHELSFDERADLKAPELLGPVFLAVQEDDESEDSFRRKQKLSQSIDDLCEMISEDETEDLPLRRRAMSLEGRKSARIKNQRTKVPTKEELMKAFQELRNEIMDDKDLDELVEEEEEQEEEQEEEMEEKHGEEEEEETEKEEEEEAEKGDEEEKERGGKENEEEENEEEKIIEVAKNENVNVNETRSNDLEEWEDEDQNGLHDPARWHTVVFNGQHKVIDLKLLEPFLKVLTHGGYHHGGGKKTVIVVLTACNLPNKAMKRYSLLMEQLFFFIISTMDILVTSEEYIFVYFHGGTKKNQSPSLSWLKKYYQYISRRLKKSLTKVYVVHPNLWLKSVFRLCRPFLSSNFARKLKFVNTLTELSTYVKTDFIYIPDEVVRVDPDYRKLHAS